MPGEDQKAVQRLALRADENKLGAAGAPSAGADLNPIQADHWTWVPGR